MTQLTEDPARAGTAPDGAVAERSPPMAAGISWALLTVLIWSAWPSVTRQSVISTLSPQDLVALRYAVGGMLLLPALLRRRSPLPLKGWREGLVLAFCQGAPLALLVTIGVRFAPAAHMAALSPGLLPLFAAAFGAIFFGERLSVIRKLGVALIVAGALFMAGLSFQTLSSGIWRGDLLFACAGFMGSIYAVRMRRSGLSAMDGAALIGVYSMLFYLPLYGWLWWPTSGLAAAPAAELWFQASYQGLLMGFVSLYSLSRAIVLLGATRATAFISLVPVLGTLFGAIILHEMPSAIDSCAVVLISLGVYFATGAFPVPALGKTRLEA